MAMLKDSLNKESIQSMHNELWKKLEERDEHHAQAFLEQALQKWNNSDGTGNFWHSAASFLKSPWLWVSILSGASLVFLSCLFFLWAALKVE